MKITEKSYQATGRPCFICDYSPARSGDPNQVDQADIDADMIAVAYNPGRPVRANSAMSPPTPVWTACQTLTVMTAMCARTTNAARVSAREHRS